MIIITIDGPTASGKSSVARALAQLLHIYYLNTGYLYRAVAYLLQHECNYDEHAFEDPQREDLVRILDPEHFEYRYSPEHGVSILFDSKDIVPLLGSLEISRRASLLSVYPVVRQSLHDMQRDCGQKYDLVVEGRDCGSVLFPDATIKFFLTASERVRTERLLKDPQRQMKDTTFQEALRAMHERDTRDRERSIAPLVIPQGAIIIDNSKMNFKETVQMIVDKIKLQLLL